MNLNISSRVKVKEILHSMTIFIFQFFTFRKHCWYKVYIFFFCFVKRYYLFWYFIEMNIYFVLIRTVYWLECSGIHMLSIKWTKPIIGSHSKGQDRITASLPPSCVIIYNLFFKEKGHCIHLPFLIIYYFIWKVLMFNW